MDPLGPNDRLVKGKFWQQRVRIDELDRWVDTGDIVIFSGYGRASCIIKWCTWSKWSHVGIVIKRGYEVYILEASPEVHSSVPKR
jgi:hypothetical protein